jgi:ParB-like chromosome segregation protein Spo0J
VLNTEFFLVKECHQMTVEYRTLSASSLRPFPGNKIMFKPFDPDGCENDAFLVSSIKRIGVLCPPVVSKVAGQNDYMIISGHRRIAAAQLAGQSSIHCKIVPPSSGDHRRECWLAGNMTRKLDDATACKILAENREFLVQQYDEIALKRAQNSGDTQPAPYKREEEKISEMIGVGRAKTEAMLHVGETLIEAEIEGDTETVAKIEAAVESAPVRQVARAIRAEKRGETTPEKPKQELDQAGHPIPKHLIESFDIRERFQEIIKASICLQKMVTSLMQTSPPGTERFNADTAKKHLHNFQSVLKFAVPYAVCQVCKGSGKHESEPFCPACRGAGWIGESSFKSAPPEYRVIKE